MEGRGVWCKRELPGASEACFMPIGLEVSQNVASTSSHPPLTDASTGLEKIQDGCLWGCTHVKLTLSRMKSDGDELCIHQYSDFTHYKLLMFGNFYIKMMLPPKTLSTLNDRTTQTISDKDLKVTLH